MLSIGALSRQTGVKIPTIRYYEEMGLLEEAERSSGNQRRYTQEHLKRLSFIRHSRELGFSIPDIQELITLNAHPEHPCGDVHAIAERHLEETKSRLRKLKRLEKELKRITTCNAATVGACNILETLADHRLCVTEH